MCRYFVRALFGNRHLVCLAIVVLPSLISFFQEYSKDLVATRERVLIILASAAEGPGFGAGVSI